MTTRRHLHLLTACLLAVALVGGSAPGALVLCVGAEGHADLEVALMSCCVSSAVGTADPGPRVEADGEACAGCVDVELDGSACASRSQRVPCPDAVGVLAGPVAVASRRPSLAQLDDAAAAPSPSLTLLSAVVLLT